MPGLLDCHAHGLTALLLILQTRRAARLNLVILETRSIERTNNSRINNAIVDERLNVIKEIETGTPAKDKDFLCWGECSIGPK